MKILALIGETTEYDKKETLEEKHPKSWLKSVSAFANGIGGVLIFGIANDETLVGLNDAKTISEKISEYVKARMDPIPQIILEIYTEEKKEFVLLKVLAGAETPYYYVADGNRIAFVRVGNESVPADAAALRRLVLHGSGKTYDSLPSHYQFKDCSFDKLRSVYRVRTSNELLESDFISFGLADKTGILTNAGVLLADESPARHSRLFCTRWYGLDKASGIMEALDDKEFEGSLVSLLLNGEEFVKNNTRKAWKKTAQGRLEMPEYPERAVLESIVNALIHRDYLDVGSEVHIDIFDDRLEIYSPGGMYDGSIVQNLDTDNVPSRRRNPVIADIFNRMHYMERRGSGFKKIKKDYKSAVNYKAGLEPRFYSTDSAFFVTLYNLNYSAQAEEVAIEPEKVAIGKKEVAIEPEKVAIEPEKVAIGKKEVAIEPEKVAINDKVEILKKCVLRMKITKHTRAKIFAIYEKIGTFEYFGRTDIVNICGGSDTAAGMLLSKMKSAGIIKAISGQGKGKYKFIF